MAHAPTQLHEEITADDTDMIYAKTAAEVQAKRKAFLRKWKLKCRAVADSLEEAGDRLFAFLRYPPEPWRSIRTTNAIERLHEAFQLLDPPPFFRGRARSQALITLSLSPPTAQRLGGASELRRDRTDRCPLRTVLVWVIQHHLHRPLPYLR